MHSMLNDLILRLLVVVILLALDPRLFHPFGGAVLPSVCFVLVFPLISRPNSITRLQLDPEIPPRNLLSILPPPPSYCPEFEDLPPSSPSKSEDLLSCVSPNRDAVTHSTHLCIPPANAGIMAPMSGDLTEKSTEIDKQESLMPTSVSPVGLRLAVCYHSHYGSTNVVLLPNFFDEKVCIRLDANYRGTDIKEVYPALLRYFYDLGYRVHLKSSSHPHRDHYSHCDCLNLPNMPEIPYATDERVKDQNDIIRLGDFTLKRCPGPSYGVYELQVGEIDGHQSPGEPSLLPLSRRYVFRRPQFPFNCDCDPVRCLSDCIPWGPVLSDTGENAQPHTPGSGVHQYPVYPSSWLYGQQFLYSPRI